MKKTLENLSLVFAGIVVGVVISYTPDIYAASSKLLGTKITKVMNVNYNSKFIGEAPVINGVSYIPVRAAANELGMGIEVGKEIDLSAPQTSTGTDEVSETPKSTETPVVDNTGKINQLKEQIEFLKADIAKKEKEKSDFEETLKSKPAKFEEGIRGDSQRAFYDTIEQNYKSNDRILEMQKKNLADYEAQLAELMS